MARKKKLYTFKEAKKVGNYEEAPVLSAGIDPQLHLSVNEVEQPLYLICEKDTVLVQMSGTARLELRDSNVRYFDLELGDHVYIPAGMPSRISPVTKSIHYRYKADKPGLEAVAWYCQACDAEIYRNTWDTDVDLPQEGYMRGTALFNSDEGNRSCQSCGEAHPTINTEAFNREARAEELRQE